MNIDKGKIIELDDNNEYYVLDKISLDNKCYLYLSNTNFTKEKNLFFVEYVNNKIFIVTNESIIKKLLLIVSKNRL